MSPFGSLFAYVSCVGLANIARCAQGRSPQCLPSCVGLVWLITATGCVAGAAPESGQDKALASGVGSAQAKQLGPNLKELLNTVLPDSPGVMKPVPPGSTLGQRIILGKGNTGPVCVGTPASLSPGATVKVKPTLFKFEDSSWVPKFGNVELELTSEKRWGCVSGGDIDPGVYALAITNPAASGAGDGSSGGAISYVVHVNCTGTTKGCRLPCEGPNAQSTSPDPAAKCGKEKTQDVATWTYATPEGVFGKGNLVTIPPPAGGST